MALKNSFTTGQVANLCGVSTHTVAKWFDTGKIGGYLIPGSMDRRIPRQDLIKFLKENGLPLNGLEEEGWYKILIIGVEQLLLGRMYELLPKSEDYRYAVAQQEFRAGILAANFRPDAIIVDLSFGRTESIQMVKEMRSDVIYESTVIVAIANEDETQVADLIDSGFGEVFSRPFDVQLLVDYVLASENNQKKRPFWEQKKKAQ